MLSYTSLLNHTVQTHVGTPIEPISDAILDELMCPISSTLFQNPVCLPTGSIYDKASIVNWLATKNVDPLTNTELEIGSLKLIPVLNYYLFLNCLERTPDGIITFHPPYGSLYDLLLITKKFLCTKATLKTKHKQYAYIYRNKTTLFTLSRDLPIPPNTISNDCRDYLPCLEDAKFEENPELIGYQVGDRVDFPQNWHYLTLHDILGTCAYTGRSLRGNTMLSPQGMFVHSAFKTYESGVYCLAYLSGIIRGAPTIHIKHDSLLDTIKFGLPPHPFVISCKYENEDESKPVHITDDLDPINIHRTYPLSSPLSIYDLFEKFLDGYHDWYIELNETHTIIHTKYLKDRLTIDMNAVQICNKATNFNVHDHSEAKKFQKLRMSLGLPTYESTYALDFSFLTIKTNAFDVADKQSFKMLYCVGTHFDNVTFRNATFNACVFIACTGQITFRDCEFDTSNGTCTSFFKAEANIRFVGSTRVSHKTYDAMPDRMKAMFDA